MATEVMRMRQEHEAQMTTLRNQCEVTVLRADADLSEQVCATLSAPPLSLCNSRAAKYHRGVPTSSSHRVRQSSRAVRPTPIIKGWSSG